MSFFVQTDLLLFSHNAADIVKNMHLSEVKAD